MSQHSAGEGGTRRAQGGILGPDRFGIERSSHGGLWIVSYADLVTIILTFMILILSVSTITQTKYDMLITALTGKRTGNLQEVKEKIDAVVYEQALGGEVSTRLDPDGLKIEFSNALLFESGEAELKPRAVEAFGPIVAHLVHDLEPRYGLIIEGYTDDVPIGSRRFRSNWELSTSRAIHVMERLAEAGLDRRRMSVQGFADTRAATEIDLHDRERIGELSQHELDEVRAANRRVIIRIDALDSDLADQIQAFPYATQPSVRTPTTQEPRP